MTVQDIVENLAAHQKHKGDDEEYSPPTAEEAFKAAVWLSRFVLCSMINDDLSRTMSIVHNGATIIFFHKFLNFSKVPLIMTSG